MRVFTETSPVRHVAAVGGVVFIAKAHGLERWTGDDMLVLSGTHGLIGDRVLGLAPDARRSWLWVATDGGLGYYEVASGGFVELPSSTIAASLGLGGDGSIAPPASIALAAAVDGGVWVGHARGLHHVSASGWAPTEISDPVTALYLDAAGGLWIGTTRGLRYRRPDGSVVSIGRAQGCELVAVRAITGAPEGGVMVLGTDDGGTARLAAGSGVTWWTYTLPAGAAWTALTGLGDHTVALSDDGLVAVSRPLTGTPARDSIKLVPMSATAGVPAPGLRVEPLAARLPGAATVVAAEGNELLVGTSELGVARVALDSLAPRGWLRRAEMLDEAGTLAVHCLGPDDCWIATGAPHAWRWRGEGFEPAGPPEGVVLAITRDADGVLYGLHRTGDHGGIAIARIDGETWVPLGVELKTPGVQSEVSFAQFAPDGLLWVGLRYHDEDSVQPWGVALVDVSLGAVAYHHASGDRRDRARGILPVPVGVVDVAFLGEDQVWMASREGAVRMQGENVKVWNEGSQLESELLSSVAVSAGGLVFVASPEGVGTYDGERWSFPPALHGNVNDLALSADGRLWLATDHGVAIFDGGNLKRIDVRRGLVENEVLDVTLDELGRVWARGPHSLTLITP